MLYCIYGIYRVGKVTFKMQSSQITRYYIVIHNIIHWIRIHAFRKVIGLLLDYPTSKIHII